MTVLEELAKHVPDLIWAGALLCVVWLFKDPLRHQLGRLSGLKAAGLEMSFAEQKLAGAAADAARSSKVVDRTVGERSIVVTKADRERVLARAERSAAVLKGRRLLWIDDVVTNNRKERDLLESLGLKIEQVQSNAAAEMALAPDGGGYDLILSDINRPEGEPSGLDFLAAYRQRPVDQRVPVIFYVTVRDRDKPLPLAAFGLTNRPDELLHLVIDALERRA